jgi:SpoVK/Ycf46/Vps4 family AAA+-type ATPase
VWLCTTKTEGECLEKYLFGDSEHSPRTQIRTISKGDVVFLLVLDKDELIGVFVAETDPGWNLEHDAWGGKFPYQVRVKPTGKICRVEKASEHFTSIGIQLTSLRSSPVPNVPKFFVYGSEYTKKLLALFPDEAFSKQPTYSKPSDKDFNRVKLTFQDVAGLSDVKKFIKDRMIYPMLNPKLARIYNLRVGGGLLLYGPPGTGKTIIAKATAGELDAEFLEISPSIIRGFPGDAEKKLEQLFEEAMGKPRVVIFLDEAEALLSERVEQTSSVMQRVTPVLLALFSRVAEKNAPVLIIGATNEPGKIDRAFLRPGRFDKCLKVGLPDKEAIIELVKLQLGNRPHELSEQDIEEIALEMAKKGYTGADIKSLFDGVALDCYLKYREDNVDDDNNVDSDSTIDESRLVKIDKAKILNKMCEIKPSVDKKRLEEIEQWRMLY